MEYKRNLREIIYEPVNEEYGWGKYGEFRVLIRKSDGYVNATKLCQDGGKELFHWKASKQSSELTEQFINVLGIPMTSLLQVFQCGTNRELSGTYVHPDLIPHIASWISPKFAIMVREFFELYRKEKLEIIPSVKLEKPENTLSDTPNQEEKIAVLTLNGVPIESRLSDCYINATQLCRAGGKRFNDWFQIVSTDDLLKTLESETGIPVSQLICTNKGLSKKFSQGTWIHPDLAIYLAQWVSPPFSIQVSRWIREILSTGSVSVTGNKSDRIENEEIAASIFEAISKYDEHSVKTFTVEETVWFKGKDIAEILEYKDVKQAIRNHVPKKYKAALSDIIRGGDLHHPQKITSNELQAIYIKEVGIYHLLRHSKKKEAEKFQDWICEELLPNIRTKGFNSCRF